MKRKITIPLDEQELHINYIPSEMDKNCEIYTTIPWAMKFLEKLIEEHPDDCKLVRDDQYSYTASIPFRYVKPRAPRKYSEETLAAMKERLENARKNK